MSTTPDIEALWVGAPFKPVFEQQMHPILALAFASVGLVYAGKFSVTRRDLPKELLFAAISSVALGLAVVLGFQAFGLYL